MPGGIDGSGARRAAVAAPGIHKKGCMMEGDSAKVERSISMPLGVVIERREIGNPWQKYGWRPVAVIPGAPVVEEWREILKGDGWIHYHAATLPLTLHRKETEAYLTNLAANPPRIYVVLRPDEGADETSAYRPFLVTASPYEAQDYFDTGADIVEGIPMEEGLIAWVQGFTDRHPVDDVFHKRRRTRYDPEEGEFGRPPPIGRPRDRDRGGQR